MQTTPNLGIEYQETFDIADIPLALQNIAFAMENWGAVWASWTPIVTQGSGSGVPPIVFDSATSFGYVLKVGKTVWAYGRFDVLTGTGISGYPVMYLPYPVADLYEPAGIIVSKQSTGFQTVMASADGAASPDAGKVLVEGNSNARAAGDWFSPLLQYETP